MKSLIFCSILCLPGVILITKFELSSALSILIFSLLTLLIVAAIGLEYLKIIFLSKK